MPIYHKKWWYADDGDGGGKQVSVWLEQTAKRAGNEWRKKEREDKSVGQNEHVHTCWLSRRINTSFIHIWHNHLRSILWLLFDGVSITFAFLHIQTDTCKKMLIVLMWIFESAALVVVVYSLNWTEQYKVLSTWFYRQHSQIKCIDIEYQWCCCCRRITGVNTTNTAAISIARLVTTTIARFFRFLVSFPFRTFTFSVFYTWKCCC